MENKTLDKRCLKKRLSPMIDQIIQAYLAGTGSAELAVFYKTSPATIRSLLRENGVPIRKVGRPKKEKECLPTS